MRTTLRAIASDRLVRECRRAAGLAAVALLVIGCSSGGGDDDGAPSTTVFEVSAARIASIVNRTTPELARGLGPLRRCGIRMDDCTAADQRLVQEQVASVQKLARDLDSLVASKKVPAAVRDLLEQTASAAGAVVAVVQPDTRILACGPGSSTWPAGRDECANRYRALADATLRLADAMEKWDAAAR